MNVVFLNLTNQIDFVSSADLPLSLILLENHLKNALPQVECSIETFFVDQEDSYSRIAKLACDVVGISLTYANADFVRTWLDARNRSTGPGPFIVLGGVLASSIGRELLESQPEISFVALGEGEKTMVGIIRYLLGEINISDIPGVAYRDDTGCVCIQALRANHEVMDDPIPSRYFLSNMTQDDCSRISIRIQSARGCLGACAYCNNSYKNRLEGGLNKTWRGMSPKRVVEELGYLHHTFGVRHFNFVDPSIEDPGRRGKQRLREICDRILDADLEISFKANMRTETLDPDTDMDLLLLLKEAGLDVIVLGIEAATPEEIRLFKKNASYEISRRFCQALKSMDRFCLIAGWIPMHPYATPESLRENYKAMLETDGMANLQLLVSTLVPLRGTALYDRMRADGLILNFEDIWSIQRYRYLNEVVSRLHLFLQEIKVAFPEVITTVYFSFLQAYNLFARATHRSIRRVDYDLLCFDKYRRVFNSRKLEMESILFCLRHNLLQLAENRNARAEDAFVLASESFRGLQPIVKEIEASAKRYLEDILDRGGNWALFGWQAWGSSVFQNVKM